MIGLSRDVRYRVCLIARTSGSSAACSTKASTDAENDVVGVVHEHVAAPDGANTSAGRRPTARRRRVIGAHGSSFRSGRSSAGEGPQAPRASGLPARRPATRRPRARASAARRTSSAHRRVDLEPDAVAPRCRRWSTVSIAASRSSASSSSTSTSASRVTRKTCSLDDLHAGEELVEVGGDDFLERHEALAVGEGDEARQQRRDLHPGEPALAGRRVADRRPRGSATGSRCTGTGARVDRQRREDREDPLAELVVRGTPGPASSSSSQCDAAGCAPSRAPAAGRPSTSASARPLSATTRSRIASSCSSGAMPSGVGRADPGLDLLLEAGDADLEELVEVLA